MDPSESSAAEALARTYAYDRDSWAVVQDYQRVLEWQGKHPEKGSAAAAHALDLPRSRIRRWVDDGAVPYVVQGIQTAESHGWLDAEPGDDVFRGLNVLVAWVFSSGAIHTDKFTPQFVVDDDPARERLERACERVGVETVEPDNPGTGLKGTALTPTPDGSVLGRVLVVLGAPKGQDKHGDTLSLPDYLDAAPHETRRRFARTWALNGELRPDGAVRVGGKRPDAFLDELAALFEDVTGEYVGRSTHRVRLSQDAARALSVEAPP